MPATAGGGVPHGLSNASRRVAFEEVGAARGLGPHPAFHRGSLGYFPPCPPGHDDTQPPVGFPLSGASPRLIAVTGFWILASRSHPPPLPRDLAHCGVAPGSRGNSCGSLAGRPAGPSLEPESSGSFRAGVYREPQTERHFGRSTVLSPLKNQSILVSVDL